MKPQRPGSRPSSSPHHTGGPHHRRDRPERVPDRYLFGIHAARQAILNPERAITRIQATDDGLRAIADAVEGARAAGLDRPEPEIVDRALIDRFLKGAVHQGVALEVRPLESPSLDDIGRAATLDPRVVVVALDQVTDPHNIGAILRSAAAFGALALVVTDRHAPEVTGVVAKAASGAVDIVPILRVKNLARALRELRATWGFSLVGLAEEAEESLGSAALPDRVVIVLGAEGAGMRHLTREICDRLLRLPTRDPIGSLNVSNAAAIALYEFARPRGA